MSYREALNFLHPLANYEGYSRNYARAWEICCPNMWPQKPKSKSHWCQKRFVYLRRREEPLRPPVYWPRIISVHQESWLQRWTLLRTVLWMGKIKGIIRVRCVETSMLHLHVSIKGVTKISPPPPPPPPPLPWRWRMRSEEKLFAKWFEVMPNFRKVIVFSLTRGTYTNMGTEILPPLPLSWVQTSPPPPPPHAT